MRNANALFTRITMSGFLGGILMAGIVSGGDLQVGDLVPEFSCVDDQDHIWHSRDHIGKRIVILYFYPGDFSRCCTKQAESYRDLFAVFENQCAEVIGVSGDIVRTHELFKKTYYLKQTLLADWDGMVAETFGVPLHVGNGGKAMVKNANGEQVFDEKGTAVCISRPFTAERWTFVIDLDGRIIYRNTAVAPKSDAQEVLNVLR